MIFVSDIFMVHVWFYATFCRKNEAGFMKVFNLDVADAQGSGSAKAGWPSAASQLL